MDTKKDKQKGVYRFIGGIEKAVNKLPSPFMMFIGLFFIVAILSFFQELKQREIAGLLQIKLSLVKYRIGRAKELLIKELEVEE